MKRMQKINRCISGLLAGVMTTSLISMLPAKANESELYPYTMFTGSDKDESITINSVQGGCINGNIATNGTINSSENINFNGRKQERADKEIIKINQKLRDRYFSSEDVYHFSGDYEVAEINVNLNNPLEVQGNINLSGNVNSSTEIFALENIQLNGESLNANNSVIYSQLGNVDIDFSNVNFSGLIYAPNGDVEISGQWLNLNNVVIIADTIKLDGQYINMNYSREFAEIVGLESENNDDSSDESSSINNSSSETDNNSSLIESSQIEENSSKYESSVTVDSSSLEENSSLNDSSETDNTSSNENSSVTESSSMIDSSQAVESSSVNNSSSIDDSSLEDTDMLDDDNDGLVNAYEKAIGTDKDKPDTDNDGLTDYQEIYFTGTDPLKFDSVTEGISDAEADSDKDGLSNSKEIELGTNSQIYDTDNDGLSDGDEINVYGTDPLNPDTDNDGISDGEEVKLGLDPKNGSSDGKTPDSERTFSQHIDVNSEIFAEINTEQNPFKVSMDITAAGSVENNLDAFESGYTNIISSDMTLGVVPEFTYSKEFNIEDVVINFSIKDEYINYNDDTVNEDLNGLKRYCIFKYFEDIDMLLPVETSYDENNNTISTNVDELGIYCLMDMEQWFKQLGIDTNKTIQIISERKTISIRKTAARTPEQKETPNIDVVFNVFATKSNMQGDNGLANQVVKAGEKLFNEYGEEGNVHIYAVNYAGGAVRVKGTDRNYAVNLSELEEMVERISAVPYNYPEKIYIVDTIKYFLANNILRDNSEKYYISIQSVDVYPKSQKALNDLCQELKDKHINTSIANINRIDKSLIPLADLTGGMYYTENIYSCGEPIADHIIGFHNLKDEGKVYKTISASGWKIIALEADITSDYKKIADRGVTDEDRLNYADQDSDGLLDLEELRYTYGDNQIIQWDINGKVILPTFQECFNFFADRPYMKNPFSQYNSIDLSSFDDWRVLPIKSDPTSDDSDGDSLYDGGEVAVGTNPLSYDSDKDGLDDYTELENWFDPLSMNSDGDTYNDLQEYRNGTNPYIYDLNEKEWAAEFGKGFFGGDTFESDSVPALLGQITSGFVPVVSDLRDVTANLVTFRFGSAALSAIGLVPGVGDSAKAAEKVADFIRHVDDTATIINTICKISDEIEIFEKFFELYPKLIEENLKKNEFLIKPEYDELSYTEQNIEDLLNVKVKERREKFEIASAHECVSSNCFVAGTLVTTADGKKPIEQIKIGDKVLSSMEDTNQIAFKQVTNTFVNETSELEHIHINGETITATPEHPFYVDKLGWRLADTLRAGDVLVLSNGEFVTVEWVQHEILEQPVKVYNFEVQDYHTYFVGENSVLVHNKCLRQFDKYGDSAIEAVAKCNKLKTEAETIINHKNSTQNTVNAIITYGDNAVEALCKVSPTYYGAVSKYILTYGKTDVFVKYGNEIVNALNKLDDNSKELFFKSIPECNKDHYKFNYIVRLAINKNLTQTEINKNLPIQVNPNQKSKNKDIYHKVDRKKALWPDNTYVTGSKIGHSLYTYTTDEFGRIISVQGNLERTTDGERNQNAQSSVGGDYREPTDNGGHLIATIFNGDGNLANLVPMNDNFNKGAWKRMENDWANLLKDYNVEVNINVIYPDKVSLRPKSFLIDIVVTDKVNGEKLAETTRNFDNVAGQDYVPIKLKQK